MINIANNAGDHYDNSTQDQLENQQHCHHCRVLLKRPELIQGLTNFYWWAEAVE
ncbi:MAG: hypothetical protein HC920_05515 [Oscillatoriales cyanobacterium SM2_3_0]|nr:hypothetical protein [Oscillatoriales cyanobacterium SM2_3_0]